MRENQVSRCGISDLESSVHLIEDNQKNHIDSEHCPVADPVEICKIAEIFKPDIVEDCPQNQNRQRVHCGRDGTLRPFIPA